MLIPALFGVLFFASAFDVHGFLKRELSFRRPFKRKCDLMNHFS